MVFGSKLKLGKHEGLEPLYAKAEARAVDKKAHPKKGEPGYDDCAIVSGGGSWVSWRNRFIELFVLMVIIFKW